MYFLRKEYSKYFLECFFWWKNFENVFFEGALKYFEKKKFKKNFFEKKNEKQ